MRRSFGFSLIEVLIALAVLGIAFAAMAMIQVTNLRASVTARLLTETKAAANQVLEEQLAEVLHVHTDASGNLVFDFNDYYWSCPIKLNPLGYGGLPISTDRSGDCGGTEAIGDVGVSYSIAGESGITGEGVITITVTAVHANGPSLTIGNRVTCYDIYPSPTATAPEPCPSPMAVGGGRP